MVGQLHTGPKILPANGTHPPVLLIGNLLSEINGARSVIEDLIDHLSDAGWETFTASGRSGRLFKVADMVATTWKRRHQYSVAQVDVYAGAAFVWAEVVCWVLRRANKPYILTLHGGKLPEFAKKWPGRVRRLLNSATVVTTPSRYFQEQLEQYRPDLLLLPNPIEVSRSPFKIRQSPQPKLVWLRAFHDYYNPDLAVKTLALLTKDIPDVKLVMIGPDYGDGTLPAVRKLAEELNVQNNLDIIPAIPNNEVPDWLGQSDIFLNTSRVDNTPISVLDAFACGLCVVSTNVGGLPYLLENETDALLVPSDEPAAMATAVRRVLTEPGVAERLSQNARQKVASFDWSVILPQWESLLTEVASGNYSDINRA